MADPDPANGWDILNAIAQSVGALGTTGALIVAVAVYRRQVEDQRRAQASRLSVIVDKGSLVVTNHSDLPILDVLIVLEVEEVTSRLARPAERALGIDYEEYTKVTGFPAINPGESRSVGLQGRARPRVITFTDYADRVWERRDGHLVDASGRYRVWRLGMVRRTVRRWLRAANRRRPHGGCSLNP